MKIRRILVAYDGSKNSIDACKAAAILATGFHSVVTVLQAITATRFLRGFSRSENDSRTLQEEKRSVTQAASLIRSEGITTKQEVLLTRRSTVQAIVEYGSTMKSDLTVVGSRGLGGFTRMLMGSVSSGVVLNAKSSVLVTRAGSPMNLRFKNILVSVDGSENALRAAKFAIGLAKVLRSELTVLYVIDIPAALYYDGMSNSIRKIESEARLTAEKVISIVLPLAKKSGVRAKKCVVQDMRSPVQGITGYAKQNRTDLIVVGTRGLGGFKRLLLGSVASGVVNYAPCSVLVTR